MKNNNNNNYNINNNYNTNINNISSINNLISTKLKSYVSGINNRNNIYNNHNNNKAPIPSTKTIFLGFDTIEIILVYKTCQLCLLSSLIKTLLVSKI